MGYRDLTIRVFGEVSNHRYADLAYEISKRLAAVGWGGRIMLVTDDKITATELERTRAPCPSDPVTISDLEMYSNVCSTAVVGVWRGQGHVMGDRETTLRRMWTPSMWMREAIDHLQDFAAQSEKRESSPGVYATRDESDMGQAARELVRVAEEIRERRGISPARTTGPVER
jgi:hypothetical protein